MKKPDTLLVLGIRFLFLDKFNSCSVGYDFRRTVHNGRRAVSDVDYSISI